MCGRLIPPFSGLRGHYLIHSFILFDHSRMFPMSRIGPVLQMILLWSAKFAQNLSDFFNVRRSKYSEFCGHGAKMRSAANSPEKITGPRFDFGTYRQILRLLLHRGVAGVAQQRFPFSQSAVRSALTAVGGRSASFLRIFIFSPTA
jgi:hypothetical protein